MCNIIGFKGLGGFIVFILAFFWNHFLERVFVFAVFGVTFGTQLMPEVVLGLILEATTILCKRNVCISAWEVRERIAYTTLWSGAVLVHRASWSLVLGEGQGRSGWELVTPCARSAVADESRSK